MWLYVTTPWKHNRWQKPSLLLTLNVFSLNLCSLRNLDRLFDILSLSRSMLSTWSVWAHYHKSKWRLPNLEPEIPQPFWMCLFNESERCCVRTKIWRMPELMQLLRVKSMIKYLPPNGTDALERFDVRGCSLSPAPPAIIIACTLFTTGTIHPARNQPCIYSGGTLSMSWWAYHSSLKPIFIKASWGVPRCCYSVMASS